MPPTRDNPLRLVVVISGNGSTLQAIIDAIASGSLSAEICAVVSDKADAFGLERARKSDIRTETVAPNAYPDRTAWQQALLETIDAFAPDLVVLAGFMRVLDESVVAHFAGRLINIHPSLLPALRGLHTHRRALEAQLPHHGTSIHFVTAELDGGPVILQARIPVHEGDDEASLTQRVQQAERIIYPHVLKLFSDDRIKLYDSQVFMDGDRLAAPPVWDFE